MLKTWASYQILLGKSFSHSLNGDMKEYLWERKGLGKCEKVTGCSLQWFIWDTDIAWQETETGKRHNEKRYANLSKQSSSFRPGMRALAMYAHKQIPLSQHHLLPHYTSSVLLTLLWYTTSADLQWSPSCRSQVSGSSSWQNLSIVGISLPEPQFHMGCVPGSLHYEQVSNTYWPLLNKYILLYFILHFLLTESELITAL